MSEFAPVDCKLFTGYKPCRRGKLCRPECPERVGLGRRILIINLDALGNVVVTTSILAPLKRKYPESTIAWTTLPEAAPLLENNPYLDRVLPYGAEAVSILERMRFDTLINVDKTSRSAALAEKVGAGEKLGFGMTENGAIYPFNPECAYHYALGLDDDLKFRRNDRTLAQILAESLGLEYRRDPYVLELSAGEKEFVAEYRRGIGARPGVVTVGFNTGSAARYPQKRMTVEQHEELIGRLGGVEGVKILLVGGRGEAEANAGLAAKCRGGGVVNTPATEGLRRGVLYIAACDVLVTGDTAALHVAAALGKFVVAHFGFSCAQEADLFGRGRKIASKLSCSPCWDAACEDHRCIEELDLGALYDALIGGIESVRGAASAASSVGRRKGARI